MGAIGGPVSYFLCLNCGRVWREDELEYEVVEQEIDGEIYEVEYPVCPACWGRPRPVGSVDEAREWLEEVERRRRELEDRALVVCKGGPAEAVYGVLLEVLPDPEEYENESGWHACLWRVGDRIAVYESVGGGAFYLLPREAEGELEEYIEARLAKRIRGG